MFNPGTFVPGKAADVHLVNNRVFERDFQGPGSFPVKVIVHNTASAYVGIPCMFFSFTMVLFIPFRSACEGFGIWIQKDLLRDEIVACAQGIVRACHSETISQLWIRIVDHHVPDVTCPVNFRVKGDFRDLVSFSCFEQDQ